MDQNVVNNFVRITQEHKHVVVKGAGGLRGVQGPAGAGLQISGSVATYADLPWQLTVYDAGKAYFVQADGLLYVWTGERWPAEGDGAEFVGPQGAPGYSPQATVTKVGDTATITITDRDGTTTASISDGTIPVIDDSLSLISENPVQNKVVTQAINQKQDILQNGSITTNLINDGAVTSPKVDWSSLIDKIYPVGSIYMSVNSTSPATFIGGTWQRIKDTFLLSAGDTYAAGSTGGEATHTLTVNEMPSHTHKAMNYTNGFTGGAQNYKTVLSGSLSEDSVDAVRSTGGGQAHNNMPPYLAVYVWKRTA